MAHILIAEDDASMLEFLSKALSKAGHNVTSANDGLEALTQLKNSAEKFDLLLSDIVMPGMDGVELSQKAKDLYPGLKIMFITGFNAVTMNNQRQPDANEKVLSKPFHLKDLIDQVETLLAA